MKLSSNWKWVFNHQANSPRDKCACLLTTCRPKNLQSTCMIGWFVKWGAFSLIITVMIGSVIIEWKLGIYLFIKLNTNFPPFLHNCGESERATKQISHHAKKALNIICHRGSWVFNRYQAFGSLFPHPFSAFYCGKECSGCLTCETSNIVDCPAVYKWQL